MSQVHTRPHAGQSDGKLAAVRSEIADLNDTLHSSVRDVAEQGKRTAQAAGTAAKDAASELRDSALALHDRLGKTVSDRPYTSIAVAAAAGAALMGLAMMWRRRG